MAVNTSGLSGYAKEWANLYNSTDATGRHTMTAGNGNPAQQMSQQPQPQSNQQPQPNWFELYNSLQGQLLAPSQSEISGVGNTVQTFTDRMKGAYNTQYNNSLANLGNARDYGVKRIDTQLGQAKQNLEDDTFRKYMANQFSQASRGVSGMGIASGEDARLQMNRDRVLGRLTENAQLQNEGVLNQYSAGLNDLNSQQAQYLANLSNQADSMYRELFGDLQSRYSQANQSQQSNAMKFMELLQSQYNKDRDFYGISALDQAQMNQKDSHFNNLSASEQANLFQRIFEYNNLPASKQAELAQDMFKFNNISANQQLQADLTSRGQDITMRGQDLADARGWANIGVSQERLNLDVEKAIQASGNKQIELQLKGLQTEYNTAQKEIDRLVKVKESAIKNGSMDTVAIDYQIAQQMARVKNAEQQIVSATTPFVQADNSQDNWYRNSPNFNQQQKGSDVPKKGTKYTGDWKKATPQNFTNYKRLSNGDAKKNPNGYKLATDSISRALQSHGLPSNWLTPLLELTARESSWNPKAQNPKSTAYGMFQFLNGTWKSYGHTKTSDPYGQAVAGIDYVKKRYGDPWKALAFHDLNNWY